jgi:hypothetical protein
MSFHPWREPSLSILASSKSTRGHGTYKGCLCGCLAHGGYWFFFLFFSTGVWTQGLHFEPLHKPFFVMVFLKIGCLSTSILLISASWVARITGVSHRYLACLPFLCPGCITLAESKCCSQWQWLHFCSSARDGSAERLVSEPLKGQILENTHLKRKE